MNLPSPFIIILTIKSDWTLFRPIRNLVGISWDKSLASPNVSLMYGSSKCVIEMLFDGTWTPKKFRKDCGGREDQENRIRMTILHLYCAWPQTHKFLCWALSEIQKADINWWLRRLNRFFNLRIYSLIWDVIKNHSVHDHHHYLLFENQNFTENIRSYGRSLL